MMTMMILFFPFFGKDRELRLKLTIKRKYIYLYLRYLALKMHLTTFFSKYFFEAKKKKKIK